MRIVDRATFLKLPAGTLYSKYEPSIFAGLAIKRDTCGDHDWWAVDLVSPDFSGADNSWERHDVLDAIQSGAEAPPLQEVEGRDGLFDRDQLFAVYEPHDVAHLIHLLQGCLPS